MAPDLRRHLEPWLLPQSAPGQGAFHSVPEAPLRAWAQARSLPLFQAMADALGLGIWPERLRPNRGTLEAGEQARLLLAQVAVVGAGGLGGMACLQLARLGVGRLSVCDGDSFEESNLNRQFLASPASLGQNKALAAAQAVAALGAPCQVQAHPVWATAANLPEILAGAQVVLDGLDSLAARLELEAACRAAGLPLVHASLAGLEGLVMTIHPQGPGLADLYGGAPAPKDQSAETRLGTPTPTPACLASLQVAEAMKLLLGRPGLGPGQVLHLDLGGPSLEVLRLA